MAFYCLFNTALNNLFHITDGYIYSTRQNNCIYKNDPVQKFTYPWILILCVVSCMIHDCLSFEQDDQGKLYLFCLLGDI